MFEYRVKMELTKEQLVAIYAILKHVRLGSDDVYTSAITDFLINCEAQGIEEFEQDFYEDTCYAQPELGFTFKEDEGFAIELSEAHI